MTRPQSPREPPARGRSGATAPDTVGPASSEEGIIDSSALVAGYQGLVCDLDGVVYRGAAAVPGAVEAVNEVMADGVGIVFATNNASRTPQDVARHLSELGVGAGPWAVATSSQAGAAHLAGTLRPGSRVLAVGGPGVGVALTEAGLTPVRAEDLSTEGGGVEAVMQGLGVDVTWTELAEVGYLVEAGVPWVATNLDMTLPTARGLAPGNGALVELVRRATGAVPSAVGKPGAALYDLARTRLGAAPSGTLAVGDRLDTDIAGAIAAGLDSLLVLSGICSLQEAAFSPQSCRPTYVAADATGLLHPAPRLADAAVDLVEVRPDGSVHVRPQAQTQTAGVLAAVMGAVWRAVDEGRPVTSDPDRWRAVEQAAGLRPAG